MQQRILNPPLLRLPATIPGFGSRRAGSTPATRNSFSGLDYDWSSLGTTLLDLLPQATTAAANALTSSYAVKQAQADAARIRAEAEATGALATLEKMKNSPMTWGIIAAVAVAGVVGYSLLGKGGRERRRLKGA